MTWITIIEQPDGSVGPAAGPYPDQETALQAAYETAKRIAAERGLLWTECGDDSGEWYEVGRDQDDDDMLTVSTLPLLPPGEPARKEWVVVETREDGTADVYAGPWSTAEDAAAALPALVKDAAGDEMVERAADQDYDLGFVQWRVEELIRKEQS